LGHQGHGRVRPVGVGGDRQEAEFVEPNSREAPATDAPTSIRGLLGGEATAPALRPSPANRRGRGDN
jgi:hypothetical protein